VNSKIQIGKMSNGRRWTILAVVLLVGLVSYQNYNKPHTDIASENGAAQTQLGHAKTGEAVKKAVAAHIQVRGEDILHVPSVASSAIAARNKGLHTVLNSGSASVLSVGNHQSGSNGHIGASLMRASAHASRARVNKLGTAQRTGMTIKQRSVQLKHQIVSIRRSLDFARNQLHQVQLRQTAPEFGTKPLLKVNASVSANISGLKSRVKQLETALSARQAALSQSQQLLAMIPRFSGRLPADSRPDGMAHHFHHRF